VEGFAAHVDIAEREVAELARGFIVIAGDIDDLRAFSRLAQDLLHDVVVRLRPEPAFAKLPAVDDVADEIQVFRLVMPKEIEQIRRLAATRAEVDVGQPDRAVALRGVGGVGFVRAFGELAVKALGVGRDRVGGQVRVRKKRSGPAGAAGRSRTIWMPV
jgi:hypothetical protein